MKKSLVLLLCFIMMFSVTAFAKPIESVKKVENLTEIASELVNLMSKDAKEYGLSSDDFDKVSLSQPIKPYAINEDKSFSLVESIEYYPVCSNNKIIAILTVLYGEKGESTVTLNVEFSKELNEFLSNKNNSSFAIIHDSGSLYFISKDDFRFVKDVNPSSKKKVLEDTFAQERVIDWESVRYSSISEYGQLINIQNVGLSRGMYKKLNLPYKSQTQSTCWAACVASVGQYKTGISKTSTQVADLQGIPYNRGGSVNDIRDALQDIYGIDSVSGAWVMRLSRVEDHIDDDKPVIASFATADLKLPHSVVIVGYASSVSESIFYLRDSNTTSTTMAHITKYNGKYTLMINYYGSGVKYWVNTCYLS